MPVVLASTGSCDCARVVVIRATVLGRWMAVIQVTARGGLLAVADM